jgi:hypothetical protein
MTRTRRARPIVSVLVGTLGCLLLFVAVDHGATAASSPVPAVSGGPWGYSGRRPKNSSSSGGIARGSRSSLVHWLSTRLFSVDPSGILSLLIGHGNFLIPADGTMIQDLETLFQVCHSEHVSWNMVERELVIYNFTINVPGGDDDRNAVHVSRIYFKWDSYLQPCVDIEVDNVTILIDFVDLMMTRTNW